MVCQYSAPPLITCLKEKTTGSSNVIMVPTPLFLTFPCEPVVNFSSVNEIEHLWGCNMAQNLFDSRPVAVCCLSSHCQSTFTIQATSGLVCSTANGRHPAWKIRSRSLVQEFSFWCSMWQSFHWNQLDVRCQKFYQTKDPFELLLVFWWNQLPAFAKLTYFDHENFGGSCLAILLLL